MAIHNEVEKSMHGGMTKGINKDAMQLILDNLQKYQYQYPIRSAVREIVSNGLDSISERDVAKKILKGTHKVEDFFESRDGDIYKDSKFDPAYYELRWLSSDAKVHMTYIAGSGFEKDKVEYRDNGVGLGGYRLVNYFSLGYSTKRLSKLPLGKFGIGGKSPLSTGVDFYTMESRYNGMKFRFNVYDHNVDSIIPAGDYFILIDAGTDHEYKVFFEPTEEMNGVTISYGVRKNHRQQYVDAVQSQLLYFNNIDFKILENDKLTKIDYEAEILYEDDLIVMSNNQYMSKPHILLNKVNYGYINFEELELEDKIGNIGIKISAEEVDVNPSRESVIWSEKTKGTVQTRFESVVGIATRELQKELRESDYLQWLRTCYAMSNRFFAGDTIVSRLAKIVDLTQIKPAFLPNKNLRFHQTSNLGGLYVRSVALSKEVVANRTKTKVVRKELKSIQTVVERPIILMRKTEKASNRKDKWLLSPQYQNQGYGFELIVTIQEPMTREEMENAGFDAEAISNVMTAANKKAGEKENNRYETWDALVDSKLTIKYWEIEVPEDFKGTDEEVIEEEDVKVQTKEEREIVAVAKISAKERRAAAGKILIYTPRGTDNGPIAVMDMNSAYRPNTWVPNPKYDGNKPGSTYNYQEDWDKQSGNPVQLLDPGIARTIISEKVYEWQKLEVEIKEMNDWDAEEIYYSDGQEELMHFVAMLSRDPHLMNELGYARRTTGFSDNNAREGSSNWAQKKWWKLNADKVNAHGTWEGEAYRCQHFYDNKEIMLVKTSRPNHKYFKDFRTIDKFFLTITNKTIITMSNLLIRWNTARLLKDRLKNAQFLTNFHRFNGKYADMYRELTSYIHSNYREMKAGTDLFGFSAETYNDMIKHLDKVQEFQEYVATNPKPEEVTDMAKYLFGNESLKDGMAVDPDIMKKLMLVQDYANGCGTLLNYIPALCGTMGHLVTDELEIEVKHYLNYKGMLNFKTEEEVEMEEMKSLSGPAAQVIEDLEELPPIETFPTMVGPRLDEMLGLATQINNDLTPREEENLVEQDKQDEYFNQF